MFACMCFLRLWSVEKQTKCLFFNCEWKSSNAHHLYSEKLIYWAFSVSFTYPAMTTQSAWWMKYLHCYSKPKTWSITKHGETSLNASVLRLMLQVRCNCVECVSSSDVDSLRHSRSRLNIYKALSSPSLIALSSEDPFLTAFRLSWELQELSKVRMRETAEA